MNYTVASEMMNSQSRRDDPQHMIPENPQHVVRINHTQRDDPRVNVPLLDLVQGTEESRRRYIKYAVPLFEAAMKGDWKAAKPILGLENNLVRCAITENHETLLHIAASAESSKAVEEFVTNLVQLMTIDDLVLQNKNSHTALTLAAGAGNLKTVKIIVKKYGDVIEIHTQQRTPPLYTAALYAMPEMVRYLYAMSNKMSGEVWDDDNRGWVLQKCVEAEIFDVALQIVNDLPGILSKKEIVTQVLIALAQNPKAFEVTKPNFIFKIINSIAALFYTRASPIENEREALQLLRRIWIEIATRKKDDIDDIIRGPPFIMENNKTPDNEGLELLRTIRKEIVRMGRPPLKSQRRKIKLATLQRRMTTPQIKENDKCSYHSQVLSLAVKEGNTRFIIELIRLYPDLIWKQDDKGKTIFHLAAKRRRRKIYNLLYEIGAMIDSITPLKDRNDNNMLHMVAKSGKKTRYQDVSGVAFQMQHELLWFKEVERVIPPQYRQMRNKDGDTPQDLFTRNHATLVKNAEEWMKVTASQCMVVAALIATIVFAAAFALPGGYNQSSSVPLVAITLPGVYNQTAFIPLASFTLPGGYNQTTRIPLEPSLVIFAISDAVSLICSSTSMLMFLSILTSRYAERDFLEALPKKLVIGLATLFLSIVTMLIAFSACFFIFYQNRVYVPIIITCLANILVFLYVMLQYPLFWVVFQSAYHSKNLFKRNERALYY